MCLGRLTHGETEFDVSDSAGTSQLRNAVHGGLDSDVHRSDAPVSAPSDVTDLQRIQATVAHSDFLSGVARRVRRSPSGVKVWLLTLPPFLSITKAKLRQMVADSAGTSSRIHGASEGLLTLRLFESESFDGQMHFRGSRVMTSLFISYSRSDLAFVDELCQALRMAGYDDIWIDSKMIPASAEYMLEIEQAIVSATACLFIVSPRFAASETCRAEAALAEGYKKKIIPIIHKEVSAADLPEAIRSRHWISLAEGLTGSLIAAIISAIEKDLDWTRQHALISVLANEWHEHNRDASHLLRGRTLRDANTWLSQAKDKDAAPTERQRDFIQKSNAAAVRARLILSGWITAAFCVIAVLAWGVQWYRSSRNAAQRAADINAWKEQLEEARGLYEQSVTLADKAHYHQASARLLRALEVVSQTGPPKGFEPEPRDLEWVSEAWDRYRHLGQFRIPLKRRLDWGEGRVTCLAARPDGRLLLAGNDQGELRSWETGSWKPARNATSNPQIAVTCLAFEPDGPRALCGSIDGTIRLWNSENGEVVRTYSCNSDAGSRDATASLAFAPDGKSFAAGFASGAIILQSLEADDRQTLHWYDSAVTDIGFDAAGKVLRTGSSKGGSNQWFGNGAIQVRDVASGESSGFFLATTTPVASIAVSPDGKFGLRGFGDGNIELLNLVKQEKVGTLAGHSGDVVALAFSRDGTRAMSGSADATIRIWDLAAVGEPWDLESRKHMQAFAEFQGPDGKTLRHEARLEFSKLEDKTLRLWELERRRELGIVDGHLDAVVGVAFSSDGQFAYSASLDQSIAVWDLKSIGQPAYLRGEDSFVHSVALSRDGRTALTGNDDGTVCIWDADSRTRRLKLGGQSSPVVSVAIDPEETVGITGLMDGRITVWDLVTGRIQKRLKAQDQEIWTLKLMPDRRLLSADGDGRVRLWDLESGQVAQEFVGHQDGVYGLDVSPDSKTLVTCSVDQTVRLWDFECAETLRTIKTDAGVISTVLFSRDGKSVIGGGKDGVLRIWDATTTELLRTCRGHTDSVTHVALSPDGSLVASSSFDATVRLWRLDSGDAVRTLEGHDKEVWSVLFGPGGKTVISASLDETIRVWNAATGEEVDRFKRHEKGVTSLAAGGDGTTLLSGSLDQSARLWSVPAAKPRRILREGHLEAVSRLVFTDGDNRAVSGSQDGTICLWDVQTGEQLRIEDADTMGVTGITPSESTGITGIAPFESDPILLVSSGRSTEALGGTLSLGQTPIGAVNSPGRAMLWDWNSQTSYGLEKNTDSVTCLSLSRDGRRVVTGSMDSTIRLWDLESGRQLRLLSGDGDPIWSIAAEPSGKTVLGGSQEGLFRRWDLETGKRTHTLGQVRKMIEGLAMTPDGTVAVTAPADGDSMSWNLETGTPIATLQVSDDIFTSAAISRDGNLAASGSFDNHVWIWDTKTGKPLHKLEGHWASVRSVAFSHDAKLIASGSDDMTVNLWRVADGTLIQTCRGHTESLGAIAFDPTDRWLISASMDSTLRLWNVADGSCAGVLRGHAGAASSVAFLDGGARCISTGDDATLRIWNLTSLSQEKILAAPSGGIFCVAVAGKTGLVAGENNAIRVWDISSGALQRTLEGHSGVVTSLSMDRLGSVAISGSVDGTVRVWDLQTNNEPIIYRGHAKPVSTARVLPGGRTAVSGSFDGRVKIWSLKTGRTFQTLDAALRRTASFELPMTGTGGSRMKFVIPADAIKDLAVDSNGRLLVASGARDAELWEVFDPKVSDQAPRVHSRGAGDPYREFAEHYRIIGLEVVREGSERGKFRLALP